MIQISGRTKLLLVEKIKKSFVGEDVTSGDSEIIGRKKEDFGFSYAISPFNLRFHNGMILLEMQF